MLKKTIEKNNDLRLLSTYTKIFIEFVFYIIIVVLPLFIKINIPNRVSLSICIFLALATSIVFEAIIQYLEERKMDYKVVLNIQLITSVILLTFFLANIDRINGNLFIIYGLTLMESSLNLNPDTVLIVGSIMTFSVSVEWIILMAKGQVDSNLMNTVLFVVRLMYLIFMTIYSRSLAKTILAEREIRAKIQKLFNELTKANEKLKDLDKMKDDFVSIASHELRTPMTVIRSYLWLAMNGRAGKLSEKLRFYLSRSYYSTIRLIKLVNDMLNVSRIESGRMKFEMKETDLVKLVKEVVAEIAPRSEEHKITITIDKQHEDCPRVICDQDKIKEVLINLIGNSLKFTQPGGSINISFDKKKQFFVTTVKDTGRGIEPENIPRLFQKYGFIKASYTTNQESSQGTGLGLYIARSIIEHHKGTIFAHSKGIGKGASFGFSLPIYSERSIKLIKKNDTSSSGADIIHREI